MPARNTVRSQRCGLGMIGFVVAKTVRVVWENIMISSHYMVINYDIICPEYETLRVV